MRGSPRSVGNGPSPTLMSMDPENEPMNENQTITKEDYKCLRLDRSGILRPAEIFADAKRTGSIWLGGEMELAYPSMIHAAAQTARNIAENCGYMVCKEGMSRLTISGGGIVGFYTLDWFSGDRMGPTKIEHWTCEAAWADDELNGVSK